jgi:putative molybdopterin biosynthesis protein
LLAVGSHGGLAAALRGECDVAPIHLLDPETGVYNESYLTGELTLEKGYRRMQGVATRADETRPIDALLADANLRMVNRNRGAGTRILIDQLLDGRKPAGYAYEPRSHFAVAAAIAQRRADWGVTIETVADEAKLHFQPLQPEAYDFVIPRTRRERPAVRVLCEWLSDPDSKLRQALAARGFAAP